MPLYRMLRLSLTRPVTDCSLFQYYRRKRNTSKMTVIIYNHRISLGSLRSTCFIKWLKYSPEPNQWIMKQPKLLRSRSVHMGHGLTQPTANPKEYPYHSTASMKTHCPLSSIAKLQLYELQHFSYYTKLNKRGVNTVMLLIVKNRVPKRIAYSY